MATTGGKWAWAALFAALGVACSDLKPVAPVGGNSVAADVVNEPPARQHLVVLRDQREPSSNLLAAIATLGGRITRDHGEIGVLAVSGLSDAAVATLAADSAVAAIGRDRVLQWLPPTEAFGARPAGFTSLSDQSGAFFFNVWQWNLRQIEADDAWLVSPQGDGALVCILDTGIDPGHVDLAGKVDLTKSVSFVASEPTINDYNFHGTFVAAIVTSNGLGMASVAPDARLCAVKVLDGSGEGSVDDVIAGTLYAATVGADVINMSFGALLPRSDPETQALRVALQRAVAFAVSHRALVVAGAGNDGLDLDHSDSIVVPAQLGGVLSVGATGPQNQTNFDHLASYTNFGKTSVSLVAPGGENAALTGNMQDGILSACSRFVTFTNCSSGFQYLAPGFGTSFAAPHVSGAAAVLESALPGDQDGFQLQSCLFKGVVHPDRKLLSPLYGRGRIDVLRSLQASGCAQVAAQ